MTDREAIRRLAATVARYAERNDEGQLRSEVMELLDAMSEPAAPTETGHDSGHRGPTVTREQADWMASAARTSCTLRHLPVPSQSEMPAFFRAVADKLEGE